MVKKNVKKIITHAKADVLSLEQDEYLDLDLSHLMQYADLDLEEQGTPAQAYHFQDEELN